jgi:hypothetical protein
MRVFNQLRSANVIPLEPHTVENESNAVLVSNIQRVANDKRETEELLKLYFKHPLRSLGGEVLDLVRTEDGDSVVVSFQDSQGECTATFTPVSFDSPALCFSDIYTENLIA